MKLFKKKIPHKSLFHNKKKIHESPKWHVMTIKFFFFSLPNFHGYITIICCWYNLYTMRNVLWIKRENITHVLYEWWVDHIYYYGRLWKIGKGKIQIKYPRCIYNVRETELFTMLRLARNWAKYFKQVELCQKNNCFAGFYVYSTLLKNQRNVMLRYSFGTVLNHECGIWPLLLNSKIALEFIPKHMVYCFVRTLKFVKTPFDQSKHDTWIYVMTILVTEIHYYVVPMTT